MDGVLVSIKCARVLRVSDWREIMSASDTTENYRDIV